MRFFYLFVVALFFPGSCYSNIPKQTEPVIVAYVVARGHQLADPTHIIHINYAFGEVDNFNGIKINNESRLTAISDLQQKPSLNVLVSLGGWGKGDFSEMAANKTYRKAFVEDCKRVVDQFNLDGIDMDWEYPSSSEASISSSPEDMDNFTILMCEIREILSNDKLLTFASSSSARYVDFRTVNPYVDFINIMTYDMGMPPYHHAGIVPEKRTIGIPFYGKGLPNIRFQDISNLTDYYTEQWDDISKVPYLTNTTSEFVFTYENARLDKEGKE
jgi:chitinase